MWGRFPTCAAVGYRRQSRPIANRPQLIKLPHKVRPAAQRAGSVFHEVSRAEGPSQQTTKGDGLPYLVIKVVFMRSKALLAVPAIALTLAAYAFSQTLPPGVAEKASMGGITEYDFPNGLRVLLYPDAANPKITVNVTYLVGSRHEGYGETGMAHLLEHMNFIETTNGRQHQEGDRRPRRQLERHHLLRPHQLLRNRHRHRRQPEVGARSGSRPHGQHASSTSRFSTRK